MFRWRLRPRRHGRPTRPAYAPSPQLGVARMSKPRNARLWLSSTCAVPRQSDEALAKSSAKQINFSRNAGSLISRNAFIKRTPSLGSAASDSRSLLACSSRLYSSFTTNRSEPIEPTFVCGRASLSTTHELTDQPAPAAPTRCNQLCCIKIVAAAIYEAMSRPG